MRTPEIKHLEGIAGRNQIRVELDGDLLCSFPYLAEYPETKDLAEHSASVFKSGVEVGLRLKEKESSMIPMGYRAPFYVSHEQGDLIVIRDADNHELTAFNHVTQVPLNDTAALEKELQDWHDMAQWIVDAMNAHAE